MRFTTFFSFGAALICAAFLVACGGGGHSGGLAGGVPGGPQQVTNNSGPGTHVTVVINRTPQKARVRSHGRRGTQAKRQPKFIGGSARGLQITVSATGVASQSVYADVSGSSPLCTTNGNIETCVLNVPTLAANEQVTALETDTLPTGENSGYGTGFGTGSNILGAIAQSQTVQLGGSNAIALELRPVSALFYECTGDFSPPSPLPQPYSANFGADTTNSGLLSGARLVVTAGVAASGSIQMNFCDFDEDYQDYDTTPAPFVDVNGSPTPITVTSNSSAVSFAAFPNTSTTAPPASAYSSTASIPNDGYYWQNAWLVVGIQTTAAFSSQATITVNNNLTALNSFLTPPSSYANTMTYTIVPISVSSQTATVSQSATVFLTATDFGATNGTDGESSYTANSGPGDGGADEDCKSGGGTTLAYAYSNGPINTTTWQQQIEIDGAGNGTGTCTFYVMDYEALTVTQAVTVTVTP